MAEPKIDLKLFSAPVQISDAQISELLYSKVSQCADIKSVTPNPKVGIASLTGKFCNYIVEHKHGSIHVKTKMNYGMSVVLSAISIPFALWFVNAFDFSVHFSSYAIPLSLIFLSYGISWFVGFTLGDKEQKSILSFIYNILTNNPATDPVRNARGVGANKMMALVSLLAGIAVLVLNFTILAPTP